MERPEALEELLNRSMYELEINVRIYNCLDRYFSMHSEMDVEKFENGDPNPRLKSIISIPNRVLLSMKNFGKKSLRQFLEPFVCEGLPLIDEKVYEMEMVKTYRCLQEGKEKFTRFQEYAPFRNAISFYHETRPSSRLGFYDYLLAFEIADSANAKKLLTELSKKMRNKLSNRKSDRVLSI